MSYRRASLGLLLVIALLARVDDLRAQELTERILAVVDDDPILLSEVDRALVLGLVELEEEDPEAARRRTLDRLIEQRLLFHEVERYGFSNVPESVVDRQVDAIRAKAGDPEGLQRRLDALGMDERELRDLLARQLQVVTFVQERLGPRIFVALSDIERYYEGELAPRLRASGATLLPLEDLRESIRAVLKEERLQDELDRWTEDLRGEAEVVDYFDEKARDFPSLVMTSTDEELAFTESGQ